MNEQTEWQSCEPEVKESVEIPDQDDLFPGSFFRIPGPPKLGKTGWSLNWGSIIHHEDTKFIQRFFGFVLDRDETSQFWTCLV